MRPICATHNVEMKPSQNGRLVLFNDANGRPYQIWSGDRYDCPAGGCAVISGFGSEPVAEHFQPEFARWERRVETVVK